MTILASAAGKPKMCLQENLVDCADCGGLGGLHTGTHTHAVEQKITRGPSENGMYDISLKAGCNI